MLFKLNQILKDIRRSAKNKKKRISKTKKDGCWKGYHRVPGTQQYAKGSCEINQ